MTDHGTQAPLAIVGLSCLFPKSNGLDEFWSNIRRGVDAITEIPPTHWDPDAYFDADPKSPDMTYARRGGFLAPLPFDPLEYGIAPSNLEAIDTSQLLGLVAAKRALDHAGYGADGKPFDRNRAACILGVTGALEMVVPLGARLGHPKWKKALQDAGVPDDIAADVIERIGDQYVPWQENSFPGLLGNVVAGRIANRLDLHGTNCVVDAACASSLSALHLAAMELWSGRSDLAVTGGIDTFNDIFMFMCFSKTPALSATGDARPFSDQADGTILGEGVGVVVLKRVADAERDGDRIYALLRGIGTSSDGAGSAVYAPKKDGQVRCLEDAYRTAGVSPATIELVEAHGTGTKIGDATEVQGLNDVYRASGRAGRWCALGSVKSQIGHTKAAAGAAGLIKAIMALQHRVLPPTIKVDQPQDVLTAADSPFYVNTQARPWLASPDHPRRAAVSAFGFGGSNFHCVLEEAPAATPAADWDGDVVLAAFSATTRPQLQQQLSSWNTNGDWSATRYRALQSRASFRSDDPFRLVLLLERDRSDVSALVRTAIEGIDAYADRPQWSTPDGIYFGSGAVNGRLAVLFPGQGSQYVGMLRELSLRFPDFQDVLGEANAAFTEAHGSPSVGLHQRLSDVIYPPRAFSDNARDDQEQRLRATQIAQPAIGAVSLAALAVLRRLGVTPELTAGHSYGELTALCASQRFAPAALYRLSMLRGRLMAEAQEVDGGMLALGASLAQVEEAIQEAAVDLVVANRNGPNQVVLSGRLPEIERATELFARKNIRGKRLPVAAAFHSPLVATASERFRPVLAEVDFTTGDMPVYANSSAAEYPADADAARDLLAGQLAQPVEFVRQIENMYSAGARTFVEIGPGSVLTGLVGSILSGREHRAMAVDASLGKRAGLYDLGSVLAQLTVAGHAVKLTAWDPTVVAPPVEDSQRLRVPLSGANYVKPRPAKRPRRPWTPTATAEITPSVPLPPTPFVTSSPAPALSGPLAMLQRLQEETARLHRQFLEGQETALGTLRDLLRGGVGTVTLPASMSSPVPVSLPPLEIAKPQALVEVARSEKPQALQPVAQQVGSLTDAVLAVVAEKTGYPVAMLQPAMSLDHDLGIDSIKRVEILSALQERRPDLPSVTPEQLQTLHRLQDVIELLEKTAKPQALQPVAQQVGSLTDAVLAVVAEKTGYPVAMLQPAMSLDHDLGIDSIKRVEILSALQERRPDLPSVTPEQLQTLHRLQDVIELLERSAKPQALQPVAPQVGSLTDAVLAVVAEKTGYPVAMLQPTMSLDHDLGIDSIKRVEILSALQERRPDLPSVTPEQLQTLHRLQDVIELLEKTAKPPALSSVASVTEVVTPRVEATKISIPLTRGVVRVTSLPDEPRTRLALPEGGEFWITDDGSELALRLAKQLTTAGFKPRLVQLDEPSTHTQGSRLAGLVILSPAAGISDQRLWRALEWVQKAGPALKRTADGGQAAVIATVSRLNGSFGLGEASIVDPASGGLAGLTKTVWHEWPAVTAKAIDLAETWDSPAAAATAIADELIHVGPVECGLAPSGRCTLTVSEVSVDEPTAPSLIQPGDVALVTGGARGVTAAAAIAFAERHRPRMILLGRSAAPQPEPDWLRDVTDPSAITQALAKQGVASSPRALQQQTQQILANREIERTLAALRERGVTAEYRSVDVREISAVCELLETIRREHGPIRGLIHGAGVLADQRIEDKTREQFDRVFDTKVIGLRNLLGSLPPDELRMVGLFSSFTGRYGRTGQVDYAMANEVLNKLGQQLRQKWPASRVVAVNWGPWDGGMVQGGLKALFAQEGVGLIPLSSGAELFAREISAPPTAPVEVVVLGPGSKSLSELGGEVVAPTPAPMEAVPSAAVPLVGQMAFERTISVESIPCLTSHVLGGKAVLPVALINEWFAHAALHRNPGLEFIGLDALKILKGVRLADDEQLLLRVLTDRPVRSGGQFRVPVQLVSVIDGRSVLHASAEVLLGNSLPEPDDARIAVRGDDGLVRREEAYALLFHGPQFQGIEQIERIAQDGLVATSRTAPSPTEWFREPLRTQWLTDPLAIDVALQAMIVWSRRYRGQPCLPCGFRGYRQFRRSFPKDGVQIAIRVSPTAEHALKATVEFRDRAGQLVARLEDCENIVDGSLVAAFAQTRL